MLKYFEDIDKDCSITVIRLEVTLGVGITSRKSWTWNRRLDTAVIAMVESGEADFFMNKWFYQKSCKAENKFHAIDVQKFNDLFTILGLSAFISLFVLIFEIIWKQLLHGVGTLHCKTMQED